MASREGSGGALSGTVGGDSLQEVRKGLEVPPRRGVVRKPSLRYNRGREALPKVWERLGGPHEDPGGVGRTSWLTKRSRKELSEGQKGSGVLPGGVEALSEVLEGSRGPPGETGGVGRPSWRSRSG